LGQGDQQRRLGWIQARGFLAEPRYRPGADAFKVSAIGRMAEVKRQDRVLVQAALQGQRHPHLSQLSGPASGGAIFKQPRDLQVRVDPPDRARPFSSA
jgi:hypothetical protein